MDENIVKHIAEICISLRKMADYFQDNDPENLSREDFDNVALELEKLAGMVDDMIKEPSEK